MRREAGGRVEGQADIAINARASNSGHTTPSAASRMNTSNRPSRRATKPDDGRRRTPSTCGPVPRAGRVERRDEGG